MHINKHICKAIQASRGQRQGNRDKKINERRQLNEQKKETDTNKTRDKMCIWSMVIEWQNREDKNWHKALVKVYLTIWRKTQKAFKIMPKKKHRRQVQIMRRKYTSLNLRFEVTNGSNLKVEMKMIDLQRHHTTFYAIIRETSEVSIGCAIDGSTFQ